VKLGTEATSAFCDLRYTRRRRWRDMLWGFWQRVVRQVGPSPSEYVPANGWYRATRWRELATICKQTGCVEFKSLKKMNCLQ